MGGYLVLHGVLPCGFAAINMFCLVFCFYFLRQCWQVAQAGLNSCLNLLRTRVTHMCLHSWHLVVLFVCVKHDPESGVSCYALTEATTSQQSCLLRCARHGPDLHLPEVSSVPLKSPDLPVGNWQQISKALRLSAPFLH